MKVDNSGSFRLENLGKCSIFVNAKEVASKRSLETSVMLFNFSMCSPYQLFLCWYANFLNLVIADMLMLLGDKLFVWHESITCLESRHCLLSSVLVKTCWMPVENLQIMDMAFVFQPNETQVTHYWIERKSGNYPRKKKKKIKYRSTKFETLSSYWIRTGCFQKVLHFYCAF